MELSRQGDEQPVRPLPLAPLASIGNIGRRVANGGGAAKRLHQLLDIVRKLLRRARKLDAALTIDRTIGIEQPLQEARHDW